MATGEPSVTKSTCERYDVRSGRGCDLAIIMVDQRGGVLQITSDYGNWSHDWPRHGRESFKHFLVELGRDTDYLMNKLGGARDRYMADETMAECRKEILKARREGSIDKRTASEAWDDLAYCDNRDVRDLFETIGRSDALSQIFQEPWESVSIVQDYDAGLKSFVKYIWPLFIAELKRELDTFNVKSEEVA